MKNLSKVIIIVAVVGIVGYAATSFAGWGHGWSRGWGGGYCNGPGSGWSQKGYGGFGYQGNLTDEQIDKFNSERQAFFNDTGDLRQTLYQKRLELRSELAKQDPDAKKAVDIQKEISELESRLSQKRIEQRLKMQKENPDFFSGRGYGYGGRGMGRGMGFGAGNRGGGCW
jgi:Spy/CpxP family protein refolding chaperone